MNHDEQYEKVCGPNFQRLEDGQKNLKDSVDDLVKTIKISNGKPSVLARIDSLEHESHAPIKTTKRLTVGKFFKAEGYSAQDVARIVITLGVLYLIMEKHGLISSLIGALK